MPTYTFTCPNGHTFDKRVSRDTYQVTSDSFCGCVATATRMSVYAVNFGGFASTPGHERDMSREFKAFSEAGQELDHHARQRGLDPLPLYQMAKASVQDLASKGATADDL